MTNQSKNQQLLDSVSDFIKNLKPYVPGRSIDEVQRQYNLKEIIKLASNENALGPSPAVVEAVKNSVKHIHLYPDASYFECKKALAEKYNLSPEMISLGNGSNESIDTLIRIFCEPNKDRILISQGSFVAYKVCAHVNRVAVDEVPLKDSYQIDSTHMSLAYKQHKMIFIPNPNNPIGVYLSQKDFEPLLYLIQNNPNMLFVIDEAYSEFVRAQDYPDSFELLKKYKNVVILRTTAKVFGIAGLRVGYMFANPEIIQLVEKARLPFNVNVLAVVGLKAALKDNEYVCKSQKMVWEGLDYLYSEFKKMNLSFVESQGNFVFVDLKQDAMNVFEKLLTKGVILRPLKNYGFPNHVRITVGTRRENEIMIQALKEVL
jgi:histidinol-phosphate aminotransferase